MKSMVKLYILDEAGEKVFGEGPFRLLQATAEHGSLRRAAISMDMAYSKARKLITTAENAYGFPLLVPTIGGKTGGGSVLTPECEALMEKYARYRKECKAANERIYGEIFGE